jgi:hypothetical protein
LGNVTKPFMMGRGDPIVCYCQDEIRQDGIGNPKIDMFVSDMFLLSPIPPPMVSILEDIRKKNIFCYFLLDVLYEISNVFISLTFVEFITPLIIL